MNIENYFDLLIIAVFVMSPKIVWLVPKSQDLVIYFCLGEWGTLPQLQIRALQAKSEIFDWKMKQDK